MMPQTDAEGRVIELRRQITADLTALRQKRDRLTQWPRQTGEPGAPATAPVRGVPTWVVGAAAGLLAGIWSMLRRPKSAQ